MITGGSFQRNRNITNKSQFYGQNKTSGSVHHLLAPRHQYTKLDHAKLKSSCLVHEHSTAYDGTAVVEIQ